MTGRSIGLIGFGAIGQEVAAKLMAQPTDPITIAVLTRGAKPLPVGLTGVGKLVDMIALKPDLVVEVAGHAAVDEHVVPVLSAGIPVVLASVGALADAALQARVAQAAQRGHSHVLLPSGAIGGLDYVRLAAQSRNITVRYCSRKPVSAWHNELLVRGLTPDALTGEVELFRGSAREAALAFPQNLNVAMTLAMTSAGIDAMQVRVVADPRASGNTHEIDIHSPVGRARFVFENNPSRTNPKTSALTALSIVQAVNDHLRQLCPPASGSIFRSA